MGRVLSEQCATSERFVKDWLPRNGICGYIHFVPKHEFVRGWSNNIIADDFVKFASLDAEWSGVAASLAIPLRKV